MSSWLFHWSGIFSFVISGFLMKSYKKCFLPFIIICITFVCLHFFRVIPVTKLWKNYTVFYVSNECSYKTVCALLNEAGCADYIYLENQNVPLGISESSPEVSLAKAGLIKSNYLRERENYFFDKNRTVKIYYIPDSQEKKLADIIEHLNSLGYQAGINSKSVYPLFAVIIFFVFSSVLLFFSQNKKLFMALLIPEVYFMLQLPFYSVATALSLLTVSLFIFEKIYNREGAVTIVWGNVFLVTMLISSFILILVTGFKFLLLFIMLVCSDFCIFYLFKILEEIKDEKYSFRPVKIRSAKMIPLFTKKTLEVIVLCSMSCFLILISSFFSINTGISSGNRNLLLPSSNGTLGSLPGIDDYVNFKWEAMTYPYRSIYKNNYRKSDEGDTVYFKSYNKRNGLVEEKINSISFNEDFKKEAVNGIEKLGFSSIENMMNQQKKTKGFGFSSSGAQSITLISIILMVFSSAVPLVYYLNIRRWR